MVLILLIWDVLKLMILFKLLKIKIVKIIVILMEFVLMENVIVFMDGLTNQIVQKKFLMLMY